MRRAVEDLIGETVRVFANPGPGGSDIGPSWATAHLFVEGRVVAVIPAPVLMIEDADGVRHYHPSTLPIHVMTWDPA